MLNILIILLIIIIIGIIFACISVYCIGVMAFFFYYGRYKFNKMKDIVVNFPDGLEDIILDKCDRRPLNEHENNPVKDSLEDSSNDSNEEINRLLNPYNVEDVEQRGNIELASLKGPTTHYITL